MLITSSIAATMPGPYYATTRLPNTCSGMQNTPVNDADKDDATEVARDAFKALMAGADKVVAGSGRICSRPPPREWCPEELKTGRHAAKTKPKRRGIEGVTCQELRRC